MLVAGGYRIHVVSIGRPEMGYRLRSFEKTGVYLHHEQRG